MKLIFFYIIFIIFCSCEKYSDNQNTIYLGANRIVKSKLVKDTLKIGKYKIFNDTIIKIKDRNNIISVYIKYPKKTKIKGTIVALPGWNLPVMDWCDKTKLCELSRKQGFILILPEMAKTVYASNIYNETRKDWQIYPTRRWFIDTLITTIQTELKLLLPSQYNCILGLSTGARGVALICMDCPNIFKRAAGLSGDYDHSKITADKIMIGFYGTIDNFEERWRETDNVVFNIKSFNTPIYLAHGRLDNIVPCEQTILFYDSLKKFKPALTTKLHIDEKAGHDYNFWDSEVDNILEFFRE